MAGAIGVVWSNQRRVFERRMRKAGREYIKALKKQTREAANIVNKQVRRNIKSRFPRGTGTLAKSIKTTVRSRRGEVTAMVAPSVKRRWNRHRREGYWHIPSAYGPALERGGTVHRRPARSGSRVRRGAHTARFQAKPFMEPAVRQTQRAVLRILGRSFRSV